MKARKKQQVIRPALPIKLTEEMQVRASQKYLIYLALQEIMLDNYEDCTFLKAFDPFLYTRHKNMVTSLKANSNAAFKFIEGYHGGDAAILQFHNLVRILESLHEAIDKGGDKFVNILDAIENIMSHE